MFRTDAQLLGKLLCRQVSEPPNTTKQHLLKQLQAGVTRQFKESDRINEHSGGSTDFLHSRQQAFRELLQCPIPRISDCSSTLTFVPFQRLSRLIRIILVLGLPNAPRTLL